jgi:CelD/BcsL family acetyltransferase involved in cellulose biosynthesis
VVSELQIERHENSRSLEGLRAEWTRLLEESDRPPVFLTWEWLDGWWRHFGDGHSLKVVAVRNGNGALVGLGPFCVERVAGPWPARILKFMGTKRVSSEYLDLLAARGLEREVAAAVLRTLLDDAGSWDHAELTDLLETSIVARHLEGLAREAGCRIETTRWNRCPYLPLPETTESIGRTKASHVKRARQGLEKIGARFAGAKSGDALGPALETLFDLHQRGWMARGLPGKFRDPAVRAFHRTLAETLGRDGRMRIYSLEYEGRVIVSLYLLQNGKTVYFYQQGMEPTPPHPGLSRHSPGYALLSYCIEDSVRRGASEFDFLRGDEEYKKRWTDLARETRGLTIIPRGHRMAAARYDAERAARWLKRRIKKVLGRE